MIVAGCDVGMMTTKAVLIEDERIVAHDTVATRAAPDKAAKRAIDNVLSKAQRGFDELEGCVGTGWGRKKIAFADKVSAEAPCLVRGARRLVPSARTIIDVGGQTVTLVVLNEKGKVLDHATNDKCAAGTGKFIEIMAEALELDIDDIGPMSLQAKKEIPISSQCVVFAESEMISLVNQGEETADIVAGIHQSIVSRLATLVNRVGLVEEACVTGGVAKNIGIVRKLEEALGTKITEMPVDPQIVGALGAAVIAGETNR